MGPLPDDLSFVHPGRLWALLAVAALAAAMVLVARRRRAAGRRYADHAMLPVVAPHRPGWRRLPGPLLLVVALVLLAGAWAEPQVLAEQASRKAVVVVVLDTSTSMLATDVDPDRLTAAREAASAFVDDLPERVDVALVTFNRTSSLVVPGTPDHRTVLDALVDLPTSGGTAQGDAILTALDAVQRALPPTKEGQGPAARIVLLSDGVNTEGTPVGLAVQRAREVGVPVSTIAFGTTDGTVDVRGTTVPVPADPAGLAAIAEGSGGQAYEATDAASLADVYADIGSQIEKDVAQRPLTDRAIGGALVLVLLGAVPSLLLLGRAL
ncbi:MAG: von Willebrand factor type [Frankiales bacterium]|nr:von Willebrand factor type [Frankiales bacterium]